MPGIVNVVNWFKNKSVKLSDSFLVEFDGQESYRCAGFTIPKVIEWNEEIHKYGNTSHKMLIPKVDMLQELTIDLYEGYGNTKAGGEVLKTGCQSFFWKIGEGGFTNGRGYANYADYDSTGYTFQKGNYATKTPDVKRLVIYILNNNLNKTVYKYEFTNLFLTKATPYELSYSDESICKWSLSFTFETFTKGRPKNSAEGVTE